MDCTTYQLHFPWIVFVFSSALQAGQRVCGRCPSLNAMEAHLMVPTVENLTPSSTPRQMAEVAKPGKYYLKERACISDGVRMDSQEINEVHPGTVVDVVEVKICEEDRRVRARIVEPAGWISIRGVGVDYLFLWAVPLSQQQQAEAEARAEAAAGASDDANLSETDSPFNSRPQTPRPKHKNIGQDSNGSLNVSPTTSDEQAAESKAANNKAAEQGGMESMRAKFQANIAAGLKDGSLEKLCRDADILAPREALPTTVVASQVKVDTFGVVTFDAAEDTDAVEEGTPKEDLPAAATTAGSSEAQRDTTAGSSEPPKTEVARQCPGGRRRSLLTALFGARAAENCFSKVCRKSSDEQAQPQ